MFVDTHAHLNMGDFDGDREGVIERALKAGVEAVMDIGTDLVSSRKAAALAAAFASVYAAAGVHPHEAAKATEQDLVTIDSLALEPNVVAVGEIGLDYHYLLSPVDVQQAVFRRQIELGLRSGKPLIVHVREAMPDALRILRETGAAPYRGVFHCYGGTKDEVQTVLQLGFHVSFTGVVTFSNFKNWTTVAAVPLERLLLETDAPYMTPVPFRGKRNEPAFLVYTAGAIAGLHGIRVEDLAGLTTQNAKRLFGLEG